MDSLEIDRVLLLGDIAYDGQQVDETVEVLRHRKPIGVWGNHDLGFAYQPSLRMKQRYGEKCIEFFESLSGQIDLNHCMFAHCIPSWDPTDPVVYYTGAPPWQREALDTEFASFLQDWIVIGHYHRWFAADLEHTLDWDGDSPLHRKDDQRFFVVVNALMFGSFAILDTTENTLTPYSLPL